VIHFFIFLFQFRVGEIRALRSCVSPHRFPDIRTRRALDQKPCLRGFAETSYRAKSLEDRAPCLCSHRGHHQGLDIRFLVTSIETESGEHIYETISAAAMWRISVALDRRRQRRAGGAMPSR
jgi:hypothetical protein